MNGTPFDGPRPQRRLFCLSTGLALANGVRAQSGTAAFRIAHLSGSGESASRSFVQAFRDGMRELDQLEGRNYTLVQRYAEGKPDRMGALMQELIAAKPDVLLTSTTPAALAAKMATRTIPIVVMADADPVGNGLAASLARPGGNITGMSTSASELAPKLVELLTTALPKLSRIAVLANPSNRAHPPVLPRRGFRGQDPQGREAGRSPVRAAHKVLSRDKSQDRQCAWRQDSAGIADAHGQGDRVT